MARAGGEASRAITRDPADTGGIKSLDAQSVHRIASGQVVIDLQTAVKELIENSLDAGATSIEVRFKDYGLEYIQVVDNGTGIAAADYDAVALKHHTSKLTSFSDLSDGTMCTFGFRGEALASLCALCDSVSIVTATQDQAPLGTVLEFGKDGKIRDKSSNAARPRGTTVTLNKLFNPLPVRRKELERNSKREYAKALTLLTAYALVPCVSQPQGSVRLTCTHIAAAGKKSVALRMDSAGAGGSQLTTRSSISALWGPKALEHLVDLDITFDFEAEKAGLRRQPQSQENTSQVGFRERHEVRVRGVISKFTVGCGRTGTDRQFFFINGRPCTPTKVQKAFNEVYRTFNASQSPFVVADFLLAADSMDINVNPDKRTIFIHSENNFIQALKVAMDEKFSPIRATFDLNSSHVRPESQGKPPMTSTLPKPPGTPLFLQDEADHAEESSESPVEIDLGMGVPTLLIDSNHGASGVAPRHTHALTRTGTDNEFPSRSSALNAGEGDVEMSDISIGEDHERGPSDKSDERSGPDEESKNADFGDNLLSSATRSYQTPEAAEEDEADFGEASADRSSSARLSTLRITSTAQNARASSRRSGAERVAEPRTSGRKRSMVQMVLNTANASWNLKHVLQDSDAPDEMPRKKQRVERVRSNEVKPIGSSRMTRGEMRARLAEYAMHGSQIVGGSDVEEESENERPYEGEEGEEGDEGENSEAEQQHDQPRSDAHTGDWQIPADEGVDHIGGPRAIVPPELTEIIDLTENQMLDESRGTSGLSDDVFMSTDLSSISSPNMAVQVQEVVRTGQNDASVSMRVDLSTLTMRWRSIQKRLCMSQGTVDDTSPRSEGQKDDRKNRSLTQDAGVDNTEDDEKATDALSRVIDKTDFSSMEVIGQFNLGFIIVRRRKRLYSSESNNETRPRFLMDDLFIVDQHAADEKYNFERLQETTKIESQKLFRPVPLELTAADELLAGENLDILRQNGYEVHQDDQDVHREGSRLMLVAQPVSKSTIFDTKDLEELLHLMHDRPKGQMVRCSKTRAMFAMRACRMSVMVGMPLKSQQMTSVVRHMGTMDQPWNCPHGRPTMRHLSDLTGIGWSRGSEDRRAIDWIGFA